MFHISVCPFPPPQRRTCRKPCKAHHGKADPQARLGAVASSGNAHVFQHIQRKDGADRRAVGVSRNAVIPVSVISQRDLRGGIGCARRAGDGVEAAPCVYIPLVRLRIICRDAHRHGVAHGCRNILIRCRDDDDGPLVIIGVRVRVRVRVRTGIRVGIGVGVGVRNRCKGNVLQLACIVGQLSNLQHSPIFTMIICGSSKTVCASIAPATYP